MEHENIIQNKSFDFALSVIALYKKLIENKEFVISKQLLRSGTSIGANIEEATAARSRKDFAYKMSLSSKEARETRYWLKLLSRSQLVRMNYDPYIQEITEIIAILTAIVKTAQSK